MRKKFEKPEMQIKKYSIQIFVLLLISFLLVSTQNSDLCALNDFEPAKREFPIIFNADTAWVDSVLNSLSLEEKIAQLIMIDGYSSSNQNNEASLMQMVKKFNIGGVVFFKGGPEAQAKVINRLQKEAKTPLLIAMDAEWGLNMRLDSTISYPRQLMLGAIQDESLIYQMGYDIGKQLRRIGVHINFAPVADINNNPNNPVINSRSFGEDRWNVARKTFLYAQGLEDAGVLPVFKHFPGHGDTNDDSHYTLPSITHDFNRLDSIELFPFKYGIQQGIPAIMSAHLHVPALDSTPGLPSSLSKRIVQGLLRDTMGFDGIVFTDALGMSGVKNGFRPGEIEARALLAGNDILLMPSQVPRTIAYIQREIKKNSLTEEELNAHVRRILFAKSWAGLNKAGEVKIDSLVQDLNNPFYEVEKSKLLRNALTVLKNDGLVLPIKYLEAYNIASLAIGTGEPDAFSKSLKKYTEVKDYYLKKDISQALEDSIFTFLKNHNTLIISIQETSQYPGKKYGIHEKTLKFLEDLDFKGNLVLVFFGNPYGLDNLMSVMDKFNSIVLAYEDNDQVKDIAAQGVFGAFGMRGKLPVEISSKFPLFQGLITPDIDRLSYGIPEEEGVSSVKLSKIDSIVDMAIKIKAIPGCQVLVARDGNVIFNRAYGWHSYDRKQKLLETDLFDLASLTKIAATLPALMKLESQGRFSSSDTLGKYLQFPDSTRKGGLKISDILSHQSGLQAWIPFFYSTLQPIDTSERLISTKYSDEYPIRLGDKVFANRNIIYKDGIYDDHFSANYPVQVANNLFIRKNYKDTIYNSIINSELLPPVYRYSDLGYYFFHRIIEDITDTLLFPYLFYNFYGRLGAMRLGYLPLNRFNVSEIVPTENDIVFRKQVLRGYVHDPGAAMLGGIAGHAGLFSNANDLAKFMQVYLNLGTYGGREFLKKEIVEKYTSRVYSDNGNRRGLGFDKPEPDQKKISPTSSYASPSSYGHSGFTGTYVWMDPEYNNLLYIFLSNRIHPNQYNTKLITESIRTKVQDAIYEAILY